MSFSEHQSHLIEIFHFYQTKRIYLYYSKSFEGGVLCIQFINISENVKNAEEVNLTFPAQHQRSTTRI